MKLRLVFAQILRHDMHSTLKGMKWLRRLLTLQGNALSMLYILLLLSIARRLFQRLYDQRRCGGLDGDSRLPVLDSEFDGDALLESYHLGVVQEGGSGVYTSPFLKICQQALNYNELERRAMAK